MKALRGQAYYARIEAIDNKYQPLRSIYSQWEEVTRNATVEMALPNFAERNKLPVYQKWQGLSAGMEVIMHNSFKKAVPILESMKENQKNPSDFRKGVELILNDLLED